MFTLLSTGFALLFLVPVVFIGSCTASIAFVWGLLGYFVLQRVNGGGTPFQPRTKVGRTLNGLTGGRTHNLAGQSGSGSQQERIVVDCPLGEEVSTGREDHETYCRSPHRLIQKLSSGSSHSEGPGEKLHEGGAQIVPNGAQDIAQGAQSHPETHLTSYDPVMDKVFDWKTEFHHAGIAA